MSLQKHLHKFIRNFIHGSAEFFCGDQKSLPVNLNQRLQTEDIRRNIGAVGNPAARPQIIQRSRNKITFNPVSQRLKFLRQSPGRSGVCNAVLSLLQHAAARLNMRRASAGDTFGINNIQIPEIPLVSCRHGMLMGTGSIGGIGKMIYNTARMPAPDIIPEINVLLHIDGRSGRNFSRFLKIIKNHVNGKMPVIIADIIHDDMHRSNLNLILSDYFLRKIRSALRGYNYFRHNAFLPFFHTKPPFHADRAPHDVPPVSKTSPACTASSSLPHTCPPYKQILSARFLCRILCRIFP